MAGEIPNRDREKIPPPAKLEAIKPPGSTPQKLSDLRILVDTTMQTSAYPECSDTPEAPKKLYEDAPAPLRPLESNLLALNLKHPKTPSQKDLLTVAGQTNALQVAYHRSHGYPQITDRNRADFLKDGLTAPEKLIAVPKEGYGFTCRNIYKKEPEHEDDVRYTYLSTYTLIQDMGTYVNDAYHNDYGLPQRYEIKLVINALGRTREYQEKTKEKNPFAADPRASSHTFYNAADFSLRNIVIVDHTTGERMDLYMINNPTFVEGVKTVMIGYIARQIHNRRAYALDESRSKNKKKNLCLHIAGRNPKLPQNERVAVR